MQNLPDALTGVYGRGTGTQLPLGHETVNRAAIKYQPSVSPNDPVY